MSFESLRFHWSKWRRGLLRCCSSEDKIITLTGIQRPWTSCTTGPRWFQRTMEMAKFWKATSHTCFYPLVVSHQLASWELLCLMMKTSNTFPSLIKWLVSAATDEALRETEFVAAVPAVMDAVSAPLAEHVAQFSVVWIF